MLLIEEKEYYDTVLEFAEKTGQRDLLQKELDYLANFSDPQTTRARLFKDFAPQSFYFIMEKKKGDTWVRWFNGGLIYHGPHDNGGDGGAPTFSVNLTPTHGWSVHT
jgi:hypothetical protein